MNLLTTFFDKPILLGAVIVIPLVMFILNLLFKQRLKGSVKDSMTAAFCLYLMFMLTDDFGVLLSKFSQIIAVKLDIVSSYTDISQNVAMTIAQGSKSGFYILPFAVLLNLVLLFVGVIRTINLDIWSMWISAFAGGMAEYITGKTSYGLIVTGVSVIATLVFGDYIHSKVEKYCNLPAATFTNGVALSFAPIGGVINGLISRLPKKVKKDFTLGKLNRKFGFWGNPSFLTTVLVFLLVLICSENFVISIQMAFSMGAYVFILPRVMLFLSDSLTDLGKCLDDFSSEKLGLIGNLNIALPVYCGLGNPTALFLSVLCVPLMLFISKIFNFTTYVPFENIMYLPYIMVVLVMVCRGKIIRTIFSATVSYFTLGFVASNMAGVVTKQLSIINPEKYAGNGIFTTFYGVTPISFITSHVVTLGASGIAILILLVLLLLMGNYNRLTGSVKKYVKRVKEMRPSNIEELLKEKKEEKNKLKQEVMEKVEQKQRRRAENKALNILESSSDSESEETKDNTEDLEVIKQEKLADDRKNTNYEEFEDN